MAKKKNNLTLEEKLKNALVPEEEQPYKIPENWVWTRLGYISKLSNGEKCEDERLPYLEVKYLRGKIEAKEKISGSVVEVGAKIILVDGENSGEVFHVYEKGYLGSTFKEIDIPNGINNAFIEFYIGFFKNKFKSTKTGSAIPHLNKELYSNLVFPLPPLLEQQRIVERIESLFSKLDEAKEKIQMSLDSFETRKSAVLYQAFSGELTKKWREENGIRLDEWNNGTLQSVCSIKITDGTHQTPKYTSEENGIPFLSAKDIVTGKIKWDKIKYITEELHEELYKRVTPQKEDLLLAKNGTTGIAAIVEDDKIFDIYVTLALLRADYKKVFYRFLYYLINSPICKEQFNSKLTGIGVPNLHLRDIRNVEIVYPSLEEQKEIVRILDTIFEKEQDIQQLIDLIEKIDLMKKSILARAFRGELGTNLPEEENTIELLKSVLEV